MNIPKFIIWFIILAAISAFAAEGDRCVISGFVTDAATGEVIAGANINILDEPFGAAANLYGFFTIPALPKGGPYTMVVSAIGYEPIRKQIVCVDGEPQRYDFELEEMAITGEEVVVEAQRVGGMLDPYSGHVVVHRFNVRHSPSLVEADLFRALQLLPGVNSISDFYSGLYIWGGTPSDNLVLLDNIEVYNPTHLFGFFSTFIVDAVREVNLIKGGYPARWGGRLGSVLEVTNKDGNRKNFSGKAELSFLTGQLQLEAPLGKGSFMVAGRRTWIDQATKLISNSLDDEDAYLPYYFYDIQGRINQDLSESDQLTFSFYGGDDIFDFGKLESDDEDDDDFEYRWGNLTLSTQWTHVFNPKLFGHMVLAGSKFRTKLDFGEDEMGVVDRVGDISLKGDMSYFYSDKHTISFGGMLKWREFMNFFEYTETEYEFIPPDSMVETTEHYEWDNYTGASLIALYGEEEYRPNALWRIQGGLRAEFATNGNYFRVGPRISAQRWLDGETTLRGAYGRYYQYIHLINPLEEIGIAVFDSWIPVSEELDLKPASADHFVLGLDTDRLPVHTSASIYYKYIRNLIDAREELNFGDDDFSTRFYKGNGWAAGMDIGMEGEIGDFSGWLGYSLGWIYKTMRDKNDGEPYAPKYDRRHNIKLSLAWEVHPRFIATASFVYGSGQPYTEPSDFVEVVDGEGNVYYDPVFEDGEYHNGRLPDYHRLDVGYTWLMFDANKFDIVSYLQVLNVYYRKNVLMRDWDYDPATGEWIPDDQEMFPIIPTFGFRVEF